MQGVGPFKHDEPSDRPTHVFGDIATLHFHRGKQPYLVVPIVPEKNG
jgi:hypothetical protein